MYKEQIKAYFEANREQILNDIIKLCKIRSVREEALDNMPYGKGDRKSVV